ncbi:flagellar filament capping protein FliD, partial [Oligoflexaceae bacterium]|nr:flagellar filament capping protein FliD [Oligoflexaceae bacterium]
IRMPGISGTFDASIIDKLIEVQKIPITKAKERKTEVEDEKAQFNTLSTFLSELDTSLNGLKTKQDFYKLKVESSHPDILDGAITGPAILGTYEFEVRGMARTEKELAYGFPDKDKEPVGFGFVGIEVDGGDEIEVVIEPDATLQDVATSINETDAGVRAMVINTKYKPDSFRLLVISEESGKEATINIDPDTTFLEFKEQVTGKNLDVLFEDVPVTDEDNKLDELVDGVAFDVKRSEPGTRVNLNVTYDKEATMEGIKAFVEKYNQIADFTHQQFQVDPETNKAGRLSGDGTLKTVIRQLQGTVTLPTNNGGKFRTLAEIGITTDPKTGKLNMDDSKVTESLADDYDSVASLFISTSRTEGAAGRLADKLRNFRDPAAGTVKSRIRGLDAIIDRQDEEILKKERLLEEKENSIRRRFTSLESRLSELNGQKSFLASKFGGAAPSG